MDNQGQGPRSGERGKLATWMMEKESLNSHPHGFHPMDELKPEVIGFITQKPCID